jgi:uncharacterized protein (TIGR02453 family)
MTAPFTRKTLSFLRALKRNNDRDWFRARKDDNEAHVRQPMIALIERLAGDFSRLSPELVAEPRVSLYRIYRDTRFSDDKTPLKTHAAARFPSRQFPKGIGAGLYLEIAPTYVWFGGGRYMPTAEELRAIRQHIATDHRRLHRLVTSKAFRATFSALEGDRLSRVPRGYPPDHPAAEYLRYTRFLVGREYPAAFALDAAFYPELLRVFQAALPLVRFLNAGILGTQAGQARG